MMATNESSAGGQSPSIDAATRQEIGKVAQLAREQAKNVLKKIPALGPVAWLMMASASTRHTLLSELEWRVMPALVLDQAKLYLRDDSPVGFVSWALLSDAAAQRYRQSPHHLAASDWKSGDQVWLVDVLAPFGGAQDVLQDVREVVFQGQPVRQLLPSETTQAEILTWPAV